MRHLLIFLTVLSLLVSPVLAEDDAAVYSISGVAADVTADSATHARDQAITQAQRSAFTQLLDRLGAPVSIATKSSDDDLAALVKSFEVQSEHMSAVHYIGSFNVQFRPNAVRAYLGKRNVSFTEARSKPVLILPVTSFDGASVLWEDKTRWRQAWENTPPADGLVPIVVPAGEVEDVTLLGVADVLKGNGAAIKALADKYQTDGAAVVTLLTNPETVGTDIKLDVTHYDADGDASPTIHLILPAVPDKKTDVMALAIRLARRQLEKDWRQSAHDTAGDATADIPVSVTSELAAARGPVTHLPAVVNIHTLAEWAQIKHHLDSIQLITHTNVITLQRGSTSIEIEFHGSMDALQAALNMQGLSLKQDMTNGVWILQPLTIGAF